jgi:hypothetical protein
LELGVRIAKWFEAELGSIDFPLKDGLNFPITWLVGDLEYGEPVFKRDRMQRGVAYI